MKFFLDTADIKEIKDAASWGVLDGITTNPTHVAKSGRAFKEIIAEICDIVPGPVSAEVIATDYETIVAQGRTLAAIAPNVVVKVPIILEGLKAIKTLSDEGIKINTTLCFSPSQSLLAAKAGATYVSPFIGRLDDIGHEGMEGIRQLRAIFDNYELPTQILVASVRSPLSVTDAAVIGADVVTLPYSVYTQLIKHPLTDIGLDRFLADWNKVPAELREI